MAKSLSQQLLNTLELRRGSVINTDEVRALKRRWDATLRRCEDPTEEIAALQEHGPYPVSAEIDAAGRAWWQQMMYTPAGHQRDTTFLRGLSQGTRDALYTGIDHFTLVDFFIQWGHGRSFVFPMYRLFSKNGRVIVFTQRGWQSGGNTVD